MAEIMVKKVEGCKVAVIEGQGPYDKVGPIFDEIFDWLSQRGIESPSPPFGIYYDNPSEVAPEKCRYEICVPVEGDTVMVYGSTVNLSPLAKVQFANVKSAFIP